MKEYKICAKCKINKSFDDFYKSKKGCKNGLTPRCKYCHYIQTREWRKKNKEKIPNYCRKHGLKTRYGLSIEDFEKLKKFQNNCCAICGDIPNIEKPSQANKLHVDHCHITGKIRGLLCHLCNRGIGLFRERKDLLQKGIDYLNLH